VKKINLGLIGASGKMGVAIRSCLKDAGFIPFIAISSKQCAEFKNQFSDINQVPDILASQVDVWIEFSSIKTLIGVLNRFKSGQIKIVSGTTGLSKSEFNKLRAFAKKSSVFWSSNMSPGLWALRQSLKSLNLISDFQFTISETHHLEKKDNPSGTAITLQNDLEKILDKKIKKPIGHRLVDVFGIHQITAKSKSEILNFEHIALNRTVFAQGALKAAAFLVKKKQGFYSMEDLKIKATKKD
jgi:4-hydroxy-tetrahydrodipicolinate reductase